MSALRPRTMNLSPACSSTMSCSSTGSANHGAVHQCAFRCAARDARRRKAATSLRAPCAGSRTRRFRSSRTSPATRRRASRSPPRPTADRAAPSRSRSRRLAEIPAANRRWRASAPACSRARAGAATSASARDVGRKQRPPRMHRHVAAQRQQHAQLHAVHMLWRNGRDDPRTGAAVVANRPRGSSAGIARIAAVHAAPELGKRFWLARAARSVADHHGHVRRECASLHRRGVDPRSLLSPPRPRCHRCDSCRDLSFCTSATTCSARDEGSSTV